MSKTNISRISEVRFRFLPRALRMVGPNSKLIRKIRMKGLSIRMIEYSTDQEDDCLVDLDIYKHKHRRLFKYLQSLKSNTLEQLHSFEGFQNLRNLKHLKLTDSYGLSDFLTPYEENKFTRNLIKCLQKLPKNIQSLNFEQLDVRITLDQLRHYYKALGRLKSLKNYQSLLEFNSKRFNVANLEYQLSNSNLSYLSNLSKANYIQPRNFMHDAGEIIKSGSKNTWATGLITFIGMDRNEDCSFVFSLESGESDADESIELCTGAKNDESFVDDENEIVENDSMLEEEHFVSETKKSVYENQLKESQNESINCDKTTGMSEMLNLFPNTKDLTIRFARKFTFPEGYNLPNIFGSLKCLERLTLHLNEKLQDAELIFCNMKGLPQLSHFSLNMRAIKLKEWTLLEQFLINQHDLMSLELSISEETFPMSEYAQQTLYIKNLQRSLENKPKLVSLKLRLRSWLLGNLFKKP